MLRLKSPGFERFFQSPSLEAAFGGGEGNVALSLANYGEAGLIYGHHTVTLNALNYAVAPPV